MPAHDRRPWTRRLRSRLAAVAAVAVAALVAAALPGPAAGAQDPAPEPVVVSPEAVAQVVALLEEKAERSPVEQKVDSNLLYAARERAGEPAVEDVPALTSAAEVVPGDRVEVDITAAVDDGLLARIRAAGGEVVAAVAGFDAVRATLPLDALVEVAADPAVRAIDAAGRATTERAAPTAPVAAPAPGAARTAAPAPRSGTVVNEAVRTHATDLATLQYGATGAGVKACVLSDGVATLAERQAAGELPEVQVLPGMAGPPGGDEGTAMLELIHDIAPEAELGFASAFLGQAQFAQNIIDLRAAGCDVIVDDVSYFAESAFQDDDVARAVTEVRADGAVYLSSAGNSGNLPAGTAGTWNGDFDDLGAFEELGGWPARVHGWGEGAVANVAPRGAGVLSLQWSDPLEGSDNDYDLVVLDPTGSEVIAASTNVQDGTQDPFEIVGELPEDALVLVLKEPDAEDRYLGVRAHGAPLDLATGGATFGHNASADTISVAATPAAEALYPDRPAGPYPGRHTAADQTEAFTSDGPVRDFYAPDGTPLTPGDLSSTGGVERVGVDITAADGLTTTTPGFETFYGTSAAAPVAAAIVAQALSVRPDLTPDEIQAAMVDTAIDIEAPGIDPVSGAGIVMAPALLEALGAPLVGDAAFVEAVYGDFLGRPSDPGGREFWLTRLATGIDSPGSFVRLLAHSPEYSAILVTRRYAEILDRAPDAGGLAFWSERVRSGRVPVSELPIHLVASPEFLARAGGTPAAYVGALHQALLGRAATSGEVQLGAARIAQGTPRLTIARELYHGVESRTRRVVASYELLLHRTPGVDERQWWVDALLRIDDRRMAIGMAGSTEYYGLAPR